MSGRKDKDKVEDERISFVFPILNTLWAAHNFVVAYFSAEQRETKEKALTHLDTIFTHGTIRLYHLIQGVI